MAAVRVVDKDVCHATFTNGRIFTDAEVCDRPAAAIRSVATLPVCDPVGSAADGSAHKGNSE
ncbi:hypothetical protein E4L95_11975 [Paracoccus liaowanqingii]|uniref:Uncharacterized protein n=1 Tax=Paracoccus liaowanqingii TaxID=2560053 RepID=A0A4Z1BK48_9RHOB|nr:hypothetical protein [Paracoccus liaowanqingii]TGN59048.1 hypothetical protein E4L95_11975 [Paracoccus liaowanqingii]